MRKALWGEHNADICVSAHKKCRKPIRARFFRPRTRLENQFTNWANMTSRIYIAKRIFALSGHKYAWRIPALATTLCCYFAETAARGAEATAGRRRSNVSAGGNSHAYST